MVGLPLSVGRLWIVFYLFLGIFLICI